MSEPVTVILCDLKFGEPPHPGDITLLFSVDPAERGRAIQQLSQLNRSLDIGQEGELITVTQKFPHHLDSAEEVDIPLMRSIAKHCIRVCSGAVNLNVPVEAVPEVTQVAGLYAPSVAFRMQGGGRANAEADYAALCMVDDQLDYVDTDAMALKRKELTIGTDPATKRIHSVFMHLDSPQTYFDQADALRAAADLAAEIGKTLGIPVAAPRRERSEEIGSADTLAHAAAQGTSAKEWKEQIDARNERERHGIFRL